MASLPLIKVVKTCSPHFSLSTQNAAYLGTHIVDSLNHPDKSKYPDDVVMMKKFDHLNTERMIARSLQNSFLLLQTVENSALRLSLTLVRVPKKIPPKNALKLSHPMVLPNAAAGQHNRKTATNFWNFLYPNSTRCLC